MQRVRFGFVALFALALSVLTFAGPALAAPSTGPQVASRSAVTTTSKISTSTTVKAPVIHETTIQSIKDASISYVSNTQNGTTTVVTCPTGGDVSGSSGGNTFFIRLFCPS